MFLPAKKKPLTLFLFDLYMVCKKCGHAHFLVLCAKSPVNKRFVFEAKAPRETHPDSNANGHNEVTDDHDDVAPVERRALVEG